VWIFADPPIEMAESAITHFGIPNASMQARLAAQATFQSALPSILPISMRNIANRELGE